MPDIIYVQLGSGNGGIVVNLGADGLAFQAAEKLIADRSAPIDFRLRGTELNVELSGEIVWLSDSCKEAGICFRGLSPAVKKSITDWITRQEGPRRMPPSTERPRGDPKLETSKEAPRSIAFRPPVSPVASSTDSSFAAMNLAPASNAQSTQPPLNSVISEVAPSAAPSPVTENLPEKAVPSGPTPMRTDSRVVASIRPEDRVVPQSAHVDPSVPPIKLESPVTLPPTSPTLPHDLAVPSCPAPSALFAWAQSRRAPLIVAAAAFGVTALLILIFPIARIVHSPKSVATDESLRQLQSIPATSGSAGDYRSDTAPREASSATQTAAPGLLSKAASVVANFVKFALSAASSRKNNISQRLSKAASVVANFVKFALSAGSAREAKITQRQDGVQVWISEPTGYYYCAGSLYYKTSRPGRLMRQGDALQDGYQPRLGQPCN